MEDFTLLTSLPVIARKAGALVAIDDVTAHAALARGGRTFVDVCNSTIHDQRCVVVPLNIATCLVIGEVYTSLCQCDIS